MVCAEIGTSLQGAFAYHLFPNTVVLEEKGRPQNDGVLLVATQCLCTLLTEVPHFNFRSNIIGVLVPLTTNTRYPNVSFSIALRPWVK